MLEHPGGSVTFAATAGDALTALLAGDPIRVGGLPGLDDEGEARARRAADARRRRGCRRSGTPNRALMGAPSAAAPGCDVRTLPTSAAILSPAPPPTQMAFSSSRLPGAWGQNALSESRLDPGIANVVAARAAEVSYRVLLIKRPGRAAVEPQRAWAVIDSTPGAERTTWGSYASDRELLEHPARDASDGRRPTGPRRRSTSSAPTGATMRAAPFAAGRSRPSSPPIGRARSGSAPTSAAIGSHRTCSCLPHGLTYGRVDRRALDLVAAQERGEVVVDLLRGRSVFRPPVQAAQHFARIARERPDRRFRPDQPEHDVEGDVNVDLSTRGGAADGHRAPPRR